MPLFHYQAIDQKGHTLNGAMAAEDEGMLEQRLRALDCWLLDATVRNPAPAAQRQAEETRARKGWFTGVKRRDLIELCTLMSFQTRSGVPVVQALEVAAQDCENASFRKVIDGVRRQVEGGLLLNEALAKYPRVFDSQFVSLVRTGEMSSRIPDTFQDLRDYLDWIEQLMADVRQASIYPAVIMGVVFLFVLLLFSFVIPKFVTLMEVAKVPLPMLTKVVFGFSDLAKDTWWMWLLLFIAGIIGLKMGRRIPSVASLIDTVKLKLPILGDLNHMIAISRFAHNLALLYRSGVPILTSLLLCRGLVGNAVVENAVQKVHDKVASGEPISEAMRRQPVFPSLLLRMVAMGETSGNLDAALENVSAFYNDVIPRRIKKIFSIVEPALILFLVGLVGTVALSIFLPILSLMSAIR
jgi:type II secretory pathway component PulF